jgi:hypothetical protein
MGSSSEVHFSGFHMDGFEKREASTEQPTTSATDMYNQPFIIGVFSYDKVANVVVKSLTTHDFLFVSVSSGRSLLCICVCTILFENTIN